MSCSVGFRITLVSQSSPAFLYLFRGIFHLQRSWFVTCVEFVLWRLRHEERLRCYDLSLHRLRFRARACLEWKDTENTEKAVTKLIHTISDNEEEPCQTQISGRSPGGIPPTVRDRWQKGQYISLPSVPPLSLGSPEIARVGPRCSYFFLFGREHDQPFRPVRRTIPTWVEWRDLGIRSLDMPTW